jgi:hypothetical protein
MDPLDRIRRRFLFRACVINSLPKSGTHLLAKIVGMFPHVRFDDFFRALRSRTFPPAAPSTVMVPLGVGRPRPVPREEIRGLLSGFARGTCATGHVPFSPEMAALLGELEIRMVSLIRDPRDVAVSHAKYVQTLPGTAIFDYYQTLSDAERLMVSITGVRKEPGGPFLRDIRDRLEAILPWRSQPFNYTTSFERLVGPRGGGSRERQVQEIRAIARHLGLRPSDADIARIADRAFGGAATFRTGVIGGWREHCTAEHKRVLKQLVGQHLIDLGYEKDLDW